MIDVNELFKKIAVREASIGWDALTAAERTIVDAMLLWYEVGNGGFVQYFFNSVGDYAHEAPSAFREIGALLTAEVVEQANALFGPNGPNRDRRKRQRQLKSFPESHLAKLNELDPSIYDGPEDIEDLLSDFAERNGLDKL